MDLKSQMILEEFYLQKENYIELEKYAYDLIDIAIKQANINVMTIQHRIKDSASFKEKLVRKGEKYSSLSDITDILGLRIICYFSDDVNKLADILQDIFDVDWENSVDKRTLLSPDSFGYMSLHYIVSIPDTDEYPDNIKHIRFEIQIRSILQHTWAEIQHDLGYKTQFGIPKTLVRQLSRVAGLLEIADKEFESVRDSVNNYIADTRAKIQSGNASDLDINNVSLKEFMLHNIKMREFIGELAKLCGAEISDIPPENYVLQLRWLKKETLGDLQDMLEKNREYATKLASKVLVGTDLDILSSNVSLKYLCASELLLNNYTEEQIADFFYIGNKNKEHASLLAKRLLRTRI